jgi:hypothetical protein
LARARGKTGVAKGAKAPGVSTSPPPANPPPPVARLLLSLREIDEIADPSERRRCMLDRLDANRELAKSRCYTNKHGAVVAMPDAGTMTRIDEIALEVLGVYAAPPSSARRPVDLSVFNGGKAAEKKVG